MDNLRRTEVEAKLRNLQISEYGMLLKEWVQGEFETVKEKLVDDPSEQNAGKGRVLRKIYKTLF